MKVVVVYYSRYGNSRVAARLIAKQLKAPVHRIEEKKPRGTFRSTFTALFRRRPKIKTLNLSPGDWDLMVLVSPIWMNKPAPPVKTFISETILGDKQLGVFFSYTTTDPYRGPKKWFKRVLSHFGARLVAVGGYDTSLKNHTILKQRVWDFLSQLPPEAIPETPFKKTKKTAKRRTKK